MLKIVQHFGKHCSCHLQGEYIMVGHFWQPDIERGSRQRLGFDGLTSVRIDGLWPKFELDT
jgi:hypothetical protein